MSMVWSSLDSAGVIGLPLNLLEFQCFPCNAIGVYRIPHLFMEGTEVHGKQEISWISMVWNSMDLLGIPRVFGWPAGWLAK